MRKVLQCNRSVRTAKGLKMKKFMQRIISALFCTAILFSCNTIAAANELITIEHEFTTPSLNCCALSPDGQLIVSGGDDKKVRVWTLTGEPVWTSDETHSHKWMVWSVAWSPNGELIASGGRDGLVKVWNAQTGKHVSTSDEAHSHIDWVRSVAWSSDSKSIVAGGFDRKVKMWNALTGEHKWTSEDEHRHTDDVHSVAWSPDDQLIVSSGAWVRRKNMDLESAVGVDGQQSTGVT